MKVSKFNGWFDASDIGCKVLKSQHFNQRSTTSNDQEISLLVIHNISLPPEQFGGEDIERFFQGNLDFNQHAFYQEIKHLKVSSHFLIKRTGELIQFVSTQDRAWHAGESLFLGRNECNDFSIGVELEGSDNQPFESKQYQTLVTLTKKIMHHYPAIKPQRIMGHSDISPGRKTDPGPYFDWRLFYHLLER